MGIPEGCNFHTMTSYCFLPATSTALLRSELKNNSKKNTTTFIRARYSIRCDWRIAVIIRNLLQGFIVTSQLPGSRLRINAAASGSSKAGLGSHYWTALLLAVRKAVWQTELHSSPFVQWNLGRDLRECGLGGFHPLFCMPKNSVCSYQVEEEQTGNRNIC
jgi:hypothetical protein